MSKSFFERGPQISLNYKKSSLDLKNYQHQNRDFMSTLPTMSDPRVPSKGLPKSDPNDSKVDIRDFCESEASIPSTSEESFALLHRMASSDTPIAEMSDFHQRLYHSLSNHVAQRQHHSATASTENGSSSKSSFNDTRARKDSKWSDKPLSPQRQSIDPVPQPKDHAVPFGGSANDSIPPTVKNLSRFSMESDSDQSNVTAMPPRRLGVVNPDPPEADDSEVEHDSSPSSPVQDPQPCSSQLQRHKTSSAQSLRCEKFPKLVTDGPTSADKPQTAFVPSATGPPKLVPYGTGRIPIDLFTYDAYKAARPTIYRQPYSPHASNSFASKKFTEKGVPTSGVLGLPSRLRVQAQRRQDESVPSANVGDQQNTISSQSSRSNPDAHTQKGKSTLTKPVTRHPPCIAIEEPSTKPSRMWEREPSLVQPAPPKKRLRKFADVFRKKSSTTPKDDPEFGSALVKQPSPYPQPKKASFLSRKFSRGAAKKSKQDHQAYTHPALRSPEHTTPTDPVEPAHNRDFRVDVLPMRDSLDRARKGPNK